MKLTDYLDSRRTADVGIVNYLPTATDRFTCIVLNRKKISCNRGTGRERDTTHANGSGSSAESRIFYGFVVVRHSYRPREAVCPSIGQQLSHNRAILRGRRGKQRCRSQSDSDAHRCYARTSLYGNNKLPVTFFFVFSSSDKATDNRSASNLLY